MGLKNELMRGVSGQAKFVSMYAGIADNMEREQDAWIAGLRSIGVKASHPDDGWVDRKNNSMQFVYPQFNDGAKVGDLVALGSPQWSSANPQHRIVRLISFRRSVFGFETWDFELVRLHGHGRSRPVSIARRPGAPTFRAGPSCSASRRARFAAVLAAVSGGLGCGSAAAHSRSPPLA